MNKKTHPTLFPFLFIFVSSFLFVDDTLAIDLPVAWPSESTIVASPFGPRLEDGVFDWHRGLDIHGVLGEDIYAIEAGSVDGVFYQGSPQFPGGGNVIRLRHLDNGMVYYSFYFHLNSILVQENQMVQRGQTIGTMGDTGADTVHLHLEIRENVSCSLESQMDGNCAMEANGKDPHVNPMKYLRVDDGNAPKIQVISQNPLRIRVSVESSELDFNRIGVIDEGGVSHVLDFNERIGFDATSTLTLDKQTTDQNVTINPHPFTYQSFLQGDKYYVDFTFNDLVGYRTIGVRDVWGNYAGILNYKGPTKKKAPPYEMGGNVLGAKGVKGAKVVWDSDLEFIKHEKNRFDLR